MKKKNIGQLVNYNSGCLGCGACINVCPVNAINTGFDYEGYIYPIVDEKKCIDCHKCNDVCPFINHKEVQHYQYDECVAYAAWAEAGIRMNCSSGGASPVFSEYVIRNGGAVYGTVWNADFSCSIVGADSLEAVNDQRYSKYLQSSTELTFREVKERLSKDETVLYFGTPCQIAGLNAFLGALSTSDNLIAVDLLCSHAPSSKYFQKYISENFPDAKAIIFRSKRDMGWTCDGHVIEMENGEYISRKSSYDSYQAAYHGFVMRRQICEECRFADFPRQGDVTIGDFWGIGCEDPSWDDHNGTSLIIANSEKGRSFIQKVSKDFERIEEVPIIWARNKGNRIGNDCRKGHKNAKYFIRQLTNHSFEKATYNALYDKHDIGLVCYSNRNYGNNLTNFALYKYLSDLGFSVLMINTPKDSFFNQDIYFGDGFIENPYYKEDLSERFKNDEYVSYNNYCKCFCVGSDQLFRENFVEGMDYVSLLKFVYSIKYKFSYGTSFGDSTYKNKDFQTRRMSYMFSRFQAISVREKKGTELLREKFDIDSSVHVVDPVFLVDPSVFNSMANMGCKQRVDATDFVGGYFLDPDEVKEKFIHKISRDNRTSEIVVLDRETYAWSRYNGGLNVLADPKVEEWLAVVRDSKIFVTDSFHGLCFALIFRKDFYVIFQNNNWRGIDRISELLNDIGLMDRLMIVGEDDELSPNPINYKEVESIIARRVFESKTWLKKTLNNAMNFSNESDFYDELIYDNSKIIGECRRNSEQIRSLKTELYFLRNCSVRKEKNCASMKKTIIGFGIGNCLKRNIEKVLTTCHMSYLADNDAEKWGKEFYGIKCISPNQLNGFGDVFVIIFIDDIGVSFDIAKQLLNMGVNCFDHVNNFLDEIFVDGQ